ncbi:MAG: hypothetical protein M3010_01540, partial [Candidatus Dormibacteraeota bacterium]|nr:hypothetical protein [Candidatus Dormibacteraeota bacterium]
RNLAMWSAAGEVLAFTDDDCMPQPGWLLHGLEAMGAADVVQGKTWPSGPTTPFDHSIWAEPPTWRWETCNLFVRRDCAVRAGGFDESFIVAGEDVEWGWRLVRTGAVPAFAADAVVHHAVTRLGSFGVLRYKAAMVSAFPQALRRAPEARKALYGRYFMNQRQAVMSASLVLGVAALAVRRHRRLKRVLAAGAAGAYLSRPDIRRFAEGLLVRALTEATQVAAVSYGSVRWRRLLL